MSFILLNDQLLLAEKATIPISDRGFRYGDGIYETIAIHSGVPYQFEWHMNRLKAGLRTIKIPFNTAVLQQKTQRVLIKNRCESGLLRIQITRGSGSRGFLPYNTNGPTLLIEILPLPPAKAEPVSLWLSQYHKISPTALPVRYKLCQGLNSTLARMEADENGCFDALLCNDAGQVCETSSANIFWLKDGILHTPALSCGILEGSTRAALIRLSPNPILEVETRIDNLKYADCVWISNAAWEILPIKQLLPMEYHWENFQAVNTYRQLLKEDVALYSEAHRPQWIKGLE